MSRSIAYQPDAPDGRRWLVLVAADIAVGPGGGPVLQVDSSHEHLRDARAALLGEPEAVADSVALPESPSRPDAA